MKYTTILFDLDGTLTDPKEGITKSVQYALQKMNIDEPDLDALIPFIGPPLLDGFMEFYHLSAQQAQMAINFYRERFSDVGLFENRVFDGIEDLLSSLKSQGVQLAVATSKPTVFAEKILEHFDLAKYFDCIIGSFLDGRRSLKADVIADALAHFEHVGEVVMIGDRKHDMIGAKSHNIPAIGVTFGYGSVEELQQAGATFIVNSVLELRELLEGYI